MWKPKAPMVGGDGILTDQEAWWSEFKDEYFELCLGATGDEWLSAFAAHLYPFCGDRDPREVAELALLIQTFQYPG